MIMRYYDGLGVGHVHARLHSNGWSSNRSAERPGVEEEGSEPGVTSGAGDVAPMNVAITEDEISSDDELTGRSGGEDLSQSDRSDELEYLAMEEMYGGHEKL